MSVFIEFRCDDEPAGVVRFDSFDEAAQYLADVAVDEAADVLPFAWDALVFHGEELPEGTVVTFSMTRVSKS